MKKILFGWEMGNHGQDYLTDCVFHGLHQLDDLEIIDYPRMWYMYRNEFKPYGIHNLSDIYGRGFTMWGHMEETTVDRNDIEQKIKDHYFDLIIIGRPEYPLKNLDLILNNYKDHEIIVLSGNDNIQLFPPYKNSTYFIRGYQDTVVNDIHPAGPYWPEFDIKTVSTAPFAFPKQKIQTPLLKVRAFSMVRPGGGYVHNTEQNYYNDYRQSLFGVTRRKTGWDCMRHYEIMACRCIPYFEDLEHAPIDAMISLPRELLLHAKRRVDQSGAEYFMPGQPGWDEYQELEQQIFDHFVDNCTTDKLARYILDTHQNRVQSK